MSPSRRLLVLAGFLSLVLLSGPLLFGQAVSGSISGSVQDAQKAGVPNARISLLNQSQGAVVRELATSAEGSFVITPIDPGTYTLTVAADGFKKYEQKNIIVDAQAKVGLPPIALEIGSIGESITVAADSVILQTVSAERSGVITSSQIVDTAVLGRNFTDLMKTVPGVNADGSNVNGARSDQNAWAIDGVSFMDTGNNSISQALRVNTDSIAEFKVLSSGQQAEYGRAAGANITAITKSGTRDFHGVAYWFHRHEGLNAGSFTDNYYGRSRAIYRLNIFGFNVGGPIYIPGKFNTKKDKLFFFVNGEWQRPNQPDPWAYLTVPTALERQGDFSQTAVYGAKVTIKDPTTGQPFPNGGIPKTRWDSAGAGILSWFPAPNTTQDPAYNYQTQFHPTAPIDDQLVRIDYNVTDKWKAYFRLVKDNANPYASSSGGSGWSSNLGLAGFLTPRTGSGLIMSVTTVISPTIANEFMFGRTNSTRNYGVDPESRFLSAVSGLKVPVLYASADPAGLIPNMSFGSQIPNSPAWSIPGAPYYNNNPLLNFTESITKIFPAHTIKAGLLFELANKEQTATIPLEGTYDFSQDTSNPGETGWPYANALLGNFRSFQQASTYLQGSYWYRNYEWYIQDNWKVRPGFTVDMGMRFSLLPPQYEEQENGKSLSSAFMPAEFTASQKVVLYQRSRNPANNQIMALNPLTGVYSPAVLIGGIVPGVGTVTNGIVLPGTGSYSRGFVDSRGLLWGPRFGLAWVPPGMGGKTVVRIGGGVFYERLQGNMIYAMLGNPPSSLLPQAYYGTLATVSASGQTVFPMNVQGMSKDGHVPTVYNYNAGIQRQMPFSVLLDVSYVGNISRHQSAVSQINSPGFGSAWLPANQDPTTAAKYDGTTTLPVNFTRPYAGYGTIGLFTYGSSSNYNALQVSANRRMGRSLTFGLAYTWSKALGTQSAYNSVQHPTQERLVNYGLLNQDRRQVFTLNYMYTLPSPVRSGNVLDNRLGRTVFDKWQLSGLTTFSAGAPTNITYTVSGIGATTLNRLITGDETIAPRVVLTCNPNLPAGSRTLEAYANASCLAPSVKGSIGGDSGRNTFRLPGINNWDISLYKQIPFAKSEQRYIQLRVETYNAFNHTQWSNLNLAAQLDATGKIVNLPTSAGGAGGRFGFGALNTVRSPRNIQLAIKAYF